LTWVKSAAHIQKVLLVFIIYRTLSLGGIRSSLVKRGSKVI